MRQGQRITILDVAARAGVHPGTVSRALNRPERVARSTRERVEAAVRELGFVPNRAARGLITGRTGNIAVIVPDITNPHFASLVRSVERTARAAGLQVLLVDTAEDREEEVRAAQMLAQEVDGFILLAPRQLYRQLDVLGSTTAVFVNRPVRQHPSVLERSAPAVDEAVRHLAALGHTKLAYLDGPKGSWSASERRAAVRRTSGVAGIELVEFAFAKPTFDSAADAVDRVVRSGATAVMAFNDLMALGMLAGLARLGIAVPDDMSIVGCDDVPMAAMVAPPLTTIGTPVDEAGATAVSMLTDGTSRRELLGTLRVRGSTGPVNRKHASVAGGGAPPPSGDGRG